MFLSGSGEVEFHSAGIRGRQLRHRLHQQSAATPAAVGRSHIQGTDLEPSLIQIPRSSPQRQTILRQPKGRQRLSFGQSISRAGQQQGTKHTGFSQGQYADLHINASKLHFFQPYHTIESPRNF